MVVENISIGGALLRGDVYIPPAERVTLIIQSESGTRLTVRAETRRFEACDEGETALAVSFLEMDPDDEMALQLLLVPMLSELGTPLAPTVVILDADRHRRQALACDLTMLGARAICVTDLEELAAQMRQVSALPNAVFVSADLLTSSLGTEVAAFFGRHLPGVRRVAISGEMGIDIATVTTIQADAVLREPWCPDDIVDVLIAS